MSAPPERTSGMPASLCRCQRHAWGWRALLAPADQVNGPAPTPCPHLTPEASVARHPQRRGERALLAVPRGAVLPRQHHEVRGPVERDDGVVPDAGAIVHTLPRAAHERAQLIE